MSRVVITDRERVAIVALERIAERGLLSVNTIEKWLETEIESDMPVCPHHGPVFAEDVICICGDFQCGGCGELATYGRPLPQSRLPDRDRPGRARRAAEDRVKSSDVLHRAGDMLRERGGFQGDFGGAK